MNEVERETIRNWSGNVEFEARVYRPKTEPDLITILNNHADGRSRLRVVGSRHSMNDIAKSEAVIDMSAFNKISPVKEGATEVTAEAGVTLEALQEELSRVGLTLPGRGTIKKQTIAGAISTGTHGSGNCSLSNFVTKVRAAVYESEVATIRDFDNVDELRAARTALGALGVILKITLRVSPVYFIEQSLVKAKSLDDVLIRKDGALEYPLQFFIRFPYGWGYAVSRRRIAEHAPRGAEEERKRDERRRINQERNDRLVPGLIQKWVAPRSSFWIRFIYRWVLPIFLFKQKPVIDDDDHVQTMRHELYRNQDIELFVPESRFVEANEWLKQMILAFADSKKLDQPMVEALKTVKLDPEFVSRNPYTLHAPIVYQRVLGDDTMISMTAGKVPYYSILLLSYLPEKDDGFKQFAEFIGKGLVRLFHARPHWGKVFPFDASDLGPRYPDWERFRDLCRKYDPKGVFRNEFTARVLGL